MTIDELKQHSKHRVTQDVLNRLEYYRYCHRAKITTFIWPLTAVIQIDTNTLIHKSSNAIQLYVNVYIYIVPTDAIQITIHNCGCSL